MSLNERENQSKKTIVSAMIEESVVQEKTKATEKKEKLRQQAYYLRPAHVKAIEMRIYKNKMKDQGATDKSALIREMLDQYLNDELKELEMEQ